MGRLEIKFNALLGLTGQRENLKPILHSILSIKVEHNNIHKLHEYPNSHSM